MCNWYSTGRLQLCLLVREWINDQLAWAKRWVELDTPVFIQFFGSLKHIRHIQCKNKQLCTCLEHHFCLFYSPLAATTQVCLNSSSSGAAFRKKATFQLFLSKLLTFWGKLNTPPIHYKAPAFWAPAASQQCVHTPANTVTFYWLSCRLFSVYAKLYPSTLNNDLTFWHPYWIVAAVKYQIMV